MPGPDDEKAAQPCPLCGTPCHVVGRTTQHYEPLDDVEQRTVTAIAAWMRDTVRLMQVLSGESKAGAYGEYLVRQIESGAWRKR